MSAWLSMATLMVFQAAPAQIASPLVAPPIRVGMIDHNDELDRADRAYEEFYLDVATDQTVTLRAYTDQAGRGVTIEAYGLTGRLAAPPRSYSGDDIEQPGVTLNSGQYLIRILGTANVRTAYRLRMMRVRSMSGLRGMALARPAPVTTPPADGEEAPPIRMPSAPRERFIICPGNPRCPR